MGKLRFIYRRLSPAGGPLRHLSSISNSFQTVSIPFAGPAFQSRKSIRRLHFHQTPLLNVKGVSRGVGSVTVNSQKVLVLATAKYFPCWVWVCSQSTASAPWLGGCGVGFDKGLSGSKSGLSAAGRFCLAAGMLSRALRAWECGRIIFHPFLGGSTFLCTFPALTGQNLKKMLKSVTSTSASKLLRLVVCVLENGPATGFESV